MRKGIRILSFFLAYVIVFSSFNTDVYGMDSVSMNYLDLEETLCDKEPIKETATLSGNGISNDNGVIPFKVVELDWADLEGNIYDVEELYDSTEYPISTASDSYGEFWDDYTSYYIYNQLNEDEQKLWVAMEILYTGYLENEKNLTSGYTEYIKVSTNKFNVNKLYKLANLFKYCHPQYYYLMSGYSCSTSGSSIGFAFMVYDAFEKGTDRKIATNIIKEKLKEWEQIIDASATKEEKVKVIHDLICNMVDYNHEVLEDNFINEQEEEMYFTQSAYSVFCTTKTVCAGYTQAFMWLCNGADIECFGVTSPGHAWNKVKVDGNWYNVDCTWDDGGSGGNIRYSYYLKNDTNINHIGSHNEDVEWEPYLPQCTLDSGSEDSVAKSLPLIMQQVEQPIITINKKSNTYTVEISCATEGAIIYYTLDGRSPSEGNSKCYIYQQPFKVNVDEVIKAIGVCNEYRDSEIAIKNCGAAVTVKFVTGTEQVLKDVDYEKQSFIREPILENRPGYTFDGWYTSNKIQDETTKWDFQTDFVKEKMTLYAKWIPNTYRITFQPYKGMITVNDWEVVFEQPYGKLPIPVLEGYTFLGWYASEEATELITEEVVYQIADDSVLFAKYEANKYVITFDANGGRTDIAEKEVDYECNYGELPVPVLVDSEFLGWFTQKQGGSRILEDMMFVLLEDQTLYAQWKHEKSTEIPQVSIPAGTEVEAGTRVLLTSQTRGAKIYYTTDSEIGMNLTTENGILYEDAVRVEQNVTIYALAVKENYNNSSIMIADYTVKDTSGDWGDVSENDCKEIGITMPAEIPQGIWMTGTKSYDYSGTSMVFPQLRVFHHKTLLKEKTDYTVKYKINKKQGTVTVSITGKGNYSGSVAFHQDFYDETVIGKMKLQKIGKQVYTGKEIVPTIVLMNGKQILVEGEHFITEYENNVQAGTATVRIIGKRENGYVGTRVAQFQIEGISMKKVTINQLQPIVEYTGQDTGICGYELTYTDENGRLVSLKEGTDYETSYKNHHKAGMATIIFKGLGGYTGSVKKNYKITGYDLNGNKIKVLSIPEQKYTKNGATPKPTVIYQGESGDILLEEGKDYTLKYSNHKALPNISNAKIPNVTIVGKNGFRNKISIPFTIVKGQLSDVQMSVGDVVYRKKANICKPVLALTDVNGKKLQAGTDYNKVLDYYYASDVEVSQIIGKKTIYIVRKAGEKVQKKDIIPMGTKLSVVVSGIKNYEGTQKADFYFVMANISKASIKVSSQIYTGKNVEPDKNALVVKVSGKALAKTDYEIIEYSNNVKKGTAKITIEGRGNYSGRKTVNFKINTKSIKP